MHKLLLIPRFGEKGLGELKNLRGHMLLFFSRTSAQGLMIFFLACRNLTVRFVGITLTGEEGHLNAISKSHVTNMVCVAWGFPTPSFLMRSPPSRSNFYLLFVIITPLLFEKRLGSCTPFF
jgi:hypothetical protein